MRSHRPIGISPCTNRFALCLLSLTLFTLNHGLPQWFVICVRQRKGITRSGGRLRVVVVRRKVARARPGHLRGRADRTTNFLSPRRETQMERPPPLQAGGQFTLRNTLECMYSTAPDLPAYSRSRDNATSLFNDRSPPSVTLSRRVSDVLCAGQIAIQSDLPSELTLRSFSTPVRPAWAPFLAIAELS
jgi:hypothetical protein